MNITLIGYRGTGKSTVARLVAQRLGWDWIDADAYLEESAGWTIREIFDREGEAGFRDREAAVLGELGGRRRIVVAAGGGAVLRDANRAALRASGKVVWLRARPETITRRTDADPTSAERRPRLTAVGGIEEVRRVLAERTPLYRGCADLTVETDDRTPEQVAEEIVRAASAWGAPGKPE